MPELTLNGCAPVPLAHYLKALGILRLVSEQLDATSKGAWRYDRLELRSSIAADDLVEFFNRSYRPTPVLAPWNGGSGFFPKDNDEALAAIEKNEVARLAPYRVGIAAARRELQRLELKAKPDGDTKALLLQSCRNAFPEAALGWLDAVLVLGQDGAKFPPLLGTGGNDGRLEFTNNFMQRITEVMDPATGKPTVESERWLRAALFGSPAPGLATKAPIGQFFPGAAGGANSTSGFDAPSAVNPWDFILMIEGALLFAAASLKRVVRLDRKRDSYPLRAPVSAASLKREADQNSVPLCALPNSAMKKPGLRIAGCLLTSLVSRCTPMPPDASRCAETAHAAEFARRIKGPPIRGRSATAFSWPIVPLFHTLRG